MLWQRRRAGCARARARAASSFVIVIPRRTEASGISKSCILHIRFMTLGLSYPYCTSFLLYVLLVPICFRANCFDNSYRLH